MANKQMTNLSVNNRYFKEKAACYEKAYRAMLEAVGNFAADNPCMDLTPLGQIATDVQNRLQYQMEKAEGLRARY